MELDKLSREFDSADNLTANPEQIAHSLANNPTEHVFVAEDSGRLIGFATLQVTTSFAYGRTTSELTGIFVTSDHRRRGTGTALLSAIRDFCESANTLELFLRVNHANEGGISFYERFGLEQADHLEYRVKYY